MPSYDTPGPIVAHLEPVVGNVRVVAGERTDTVVDVRPSDANNASDVRAAQQTRVEFSGGRLTVKGPRARPLEFSRSSRSIEVIVELPAGSRVEGSTGLGNLHATGRLGACHYRSGTGHIQLEDTGELHVHTAAGNVIAAGVAGDAEVTTSTGLVRLGVVGGTSTVKNSNGATTIAAAGGPARVRAANGDITVERASAGVDAKSELGSVRVLDAVRGTLTLETSLGEIEIGIREHSRASTDLKTGFGRVRDSVGGGATAGADVVDAHAHTRCGDITIRPA